MQETLLGAGGIDSKLVPDIPKARVSSIKIPVSSFEYPETMETIRQKIVRLIEGRELTARDISGEAGIREREDYEHLDHIARSLKAHGKCLEILPSECLGCGFVFENRSRFTRPGRCPRCRSTRIGYPAYRIRKAAP